MGLPNRNAQNMDEAKTKDLTKRGILGFLSKKKSPENLDKTYEKLFIETVKEVGPNMKSGDERAYFGTPKATKPSKNSSIEYAEADYLYFLDLKNGIIGRELMLGEGSHPTGNIENYFTLNSAGEKRRFLKDVQAAIAEAKRANRRSTWDVPYSKTRQ